MATAVERLVQKVELSRRWVTVPPYSRLVKGKRQDVDGYGYWRETGAAIEVFPPGADLDVEVSKTWNAYDRYAAQVGAMGVVSRGQNIRHVMGQSGGWKPTEPERVPPKFRRRIQEAVRRFQENPRLFHLRSVVGDPTFAVGRFHPDGTEPGGTLAFEGHGHITFLYDPAIEAYGVDLYQAERPFPKTLSLGGGFTHYGQEGDARHEFAHRASEILFDTQRPSNPDIAGGRSGEQLLEEWDAIAGPFPPTFLKGVVTSPLGLLFSYGGTSWKEGFSEVVALVTSPYYEEWRAWLFTQTSEEAKFVRKVVTWVEGVVQP